MDFSALDTKKGSEEGFEVQLEHPQTSVLLPAWITVLGTDSDAYQSTLRAQQKRRMDRMARGRRANITPEDLEEEALDLLAAITSGWRAEMTLDGKPFPEFSIQAAKTLYKRFPWVREQVDVAMGNRGNFLPKSARG